MVESTKKTFDGICTTNIKFMVAFQKKLENLVYHWSSFLLMNLLRIYTIFDFLKIMMTQLWFTMFHQEVNTTVRSLYEWWFTCKVNFNGLPVLIFQSCQLTKTSLFAPLSFDSPISEKQSIIYELQKNSVALSTIRTQLNFHFPSASFHIVIFFNAHYQL